MSEGTGEISVNTEHHATDLNPNQYFTGISSRPAADSSPLKQTENGGVVLTGQSSEVKPQSEVNQERFGFSEEDWIKIKELNLALDSADILDEDLRKIMADQIPFRRKRLDDVLAKINTYQQKKENFDNVVNQTPEDEPIDKPKTEFAEKITSLDQQVTRKVEEDIAKYLQSLPTYKRLGALIANNRSGVYSEISVFNDPFREFISSLDVSAYKVTESLDAIDLERLVELRQYIDQDLSELPSHVDTLIEKCSAIFTNHHLPEEAREFFVKKLRSHIEMNNGLRYRKSDITEEISKRRYKLSQEEDVLRKEFEKEVSQTKDFFDPLIKPQIRGYGSMPECTWWTQEVLDLFVYSHGKINTSVGSVNTQSRLYTVLKDGLSSIEKKIRDIYFQRVTQSETLDLGKSEDVVYHSASSREDLLSILIDGKILSLGSLRQENPDLERATDNKGEGKRFEQEQHQIYFNNLGEDGTYPHGHTKDLYSPLLVPTKIIKGDNDAMRLLAIEVQAVRTSRAEAVKRREKYGIKEYLDRSRFCHLPAKAGSETYGIFDDPGSFYIASGFFFRKRDILPDRQFLQGDGIAVFDGDFMSVSDDRYFEIDWQQEGCFVTDHLGWAVVRNALVDELKTRGQNSEQIKSKIAEIESNLVLVPSDLWGGNFKNAGHVFTSPNPSIIMEDGTIIEPSELDFLSDYQYLDEEDKLKKDKSLFKIFPIRYPSRI